MSELLVSVSGFRTTSIRVRVPWMGPWLADVDFDSAVVLPDGPRECVIRLDALVLTGTVAPGFSGTFQGRTRARIIAGAGAWGTALGPKAYHNDIGVKAATVAQDAAREAGETLGAVVPGKARLAADFVRETGPASRCLAQVLGGTSWWVDYTGMTQIKERDELEAANGVEVLDYDPRAQIATVAASDAGAVRVGTILRSDRLPGPLVVRELFLSLEAGVMRLSCWVTPAPAASLSRLTRAVRSAVREAMPQSTFLACWRYRVVMAVGERVALQVVSSNAGLPDVLPISIVSTLAGSSMTLALSSEVLVTFIEGDPSRPIVLGVLSGVPTDVALDASGSVTIGASATSVALGPAAGVPVDPTGHVVRYGDMVLFSAPGEAPLLPATGVPISKVTA